jgi:lipopolysaccharide biosynthesis regulator YciM
MSMNLAEENPEYRSESLKVALQVYEQERDWYRAIEIAQQVTGGAQESKIENAISHYCCELAELAIAEDNIEAATDHLTKAIGHNASNPRVSLLQGQVSLSNQDAKAAVRHFERVLVQNPIYVSESLLPLKSAYQLLADPDGYRQYLTQCLEQTPAMAVVLALGQVIEEQEGSEALARFIANQMQVNPSLRGFVELIEINLVHAEGRLAHNLTLLKDFAEAMVKEKPGYRCNDCGFEGKRMRWHCPSCREWASIEPLLGQDSD